ncbi:MAG: hypothetical protein HQM11_16810 [SAR324 cluster bacterium]|nr:hypothetical protein [SAR324 cluster bacterium]
MSVIKKIKYCSIPIIVFFSMILISCEKKENNSIAPQATPVDRINQENSDEELKTPMAPSEKTAQKIEEKTAESDCAQPKVEAASCEFVPNEDPVK